MDRYRLKTLGDVLARRELEQEAANVTATPLQLVRCKGGCGRSVSDVGGHDTCAWCRKRGLRPEDPLPELKPIEVEVFVPSSPREEKFCDRPGCGNKLRSDNTAGHCSGSKACGGRGTRGKRAEDLDEQPEAKVFETIVRAAPAPKQRRTVVPESAAATTLNRFRLLAEALGFDPDEVLAGFAQGWLERARAAVRPTTPVALEAPSPPPPARELDDDRAVGAIR